MQLRADIQIQAAIKALTDTVAPAIDADNKLAVEQLQMVIGALKVVEQNLPYQFRFDCDELGRLVELARSIGSSPQGETMTGLERAGDAGVAVLARAKADPAEVLKALRDLRVECGAATTALVRDGSATVRKSVTEAVLAYSKAQTRRDRSWLLSMGFDSPDAGIAPIDQMFSAADVPD